jgi:predicted dehydrogenase
MRYHHARHHVHLTNIKLELYSITTMERKQGRDMSQHNPLKVAIIGLGGVGERIFQACLEHPFFEVAVVCDTSEERVTRIAERHMIGWTTDYHTILHDAGIDLLYVGVPPKHHHQIVMDVLEAGKHVLCEKPLANSLAEAKEMSDAALQSGVVHAMNFPTYYRSVYRELSKRISDDFLGQLQRVEVKAHFHQWPREWQQNQWISGREQGGFIREVFPHYIHMIRALFGPIHNVNSWVHYPADPALCETGFIANAELNGRVPILFDGLSRIAHQEEISFTLYGSAGTLSLQNWSVLKAGSVNEPLTTVQLEGNDRTLGLLDQLGKAIRGEQAELVDFQEGYEIQKVLESLLSA